MKSVNAAVKNAVRSSYDVNAVPRLTVEWNFNRYAKNVVSDNTPTEDSEGYDIEAFPIESIILPNRPTAGILKARVGEARVADPYFKFTGQTRSIRSYLGSTEDTYKYWTSPYPTNSLGVFPKATDGTTKVRPHVNYTDGVKTNRIVIGFEDSWAQPKDFTVRIMTDKAAGTYNVIATNPTINAKGQVILNWSGSSWSSSNTASEDMVNMPLVYGVEVRIDSLKAGAATRGGTGANSHLSLIEISARRVHDVTNRLVSVNDTFDLSDKSMVYPIGTLTSNTATVTLFNDDNALNAENVNSPFYGLMEPNASFNLEWLYTVGGTTYPVQEFSMLGGPFMGQRADNVTVELTDFSKIFQEVKPRAASYLKVSISEIVWRLCDSIGFTNYYIPQDANTNDHRIPVWYTDGTKTMWELLDDLAKGTQTAIYFDSFGILQVRTRTNAFKDASTPDWALRGVDAGTELADIVSLDQSDELSSNKVVVTYKQTDVDPVVNGLSKNQVLWQADGTVALRACPLYANLTATGTDIVVSPTEAKIWPYTGMVNIDGEFIKYDGKVYVYFVSGVRKVALVKSAEDITKYYYTSTVADRPKNFLDGRLRIVERGVWNSVPRAHNVISTGNYSVRGVVNNRGHYLNLGGFSQSVAQSRAHLNPGPRFKDANDLFVVTTGSQSDPGFYQYGTMIRFEKNGGKTQQGGLVINNQQGNPKPGNDEDGYYIDIIPTSKLSAKLRGQRNEITLWTRSGGKFKLQGKGGAFNIAEAVDYDLDVQFRIIGSTHQITVWINGKQIYNTVVKGGDVQPFTGKFGMFTRGDSHVSFEYLYAKDNTPIRDLEDDFSYLDRIAGGVVGGQLDREAVYKWRTVRKRVKKKWTKYKDLYMINFFDEFGPIVHEVREFSVDFTQGPAITSRLYMTNDWAAVAPEFSADAYHAKFYIANASRKTCIINGDDNLSYAGSTSTVNQVLSVIGRSITVKDDATVEAKNDYQIRMRGEISTEVDSTWIQSKPMAQEIANWINAHWSNGSDEQQAVVFGNPLIELGDVVTIDYPDLDMTATTHKYFVTGVANSFDTGLETTLTLRRVS